MSACWKCGVEIDSTNRSREHIILNAAGGRLKSRDLLCKSCNSSFGQSFDAVFAKELNFFANLLNITRDEGNPQTIKNVQDREGKKLESTLRMEQRICRLKLNFSLRSILTTEGAFHLG